jgi:hypothetical protein
LQYISAANIENLIQTVREDMDQIEPEDPDNLSIMNEFDRFTKSLTQISHAAPQNTNSEASSPAYLSIKTNLQPVKSIEELNEILERLYDQFKLIVKETFVLHTQNANNHSIRKNISLESKFQVIKLSYIYTFFYLICFN